MLVRKNFSLLQILSFSGHHFIWIVPWVTSIALLYHYAFSWLVIPWLPVSIIGTAVAFYLGFKNNSAYDRMWEARKIWGAIVNSSRSWASAAKNFTTNTFRENDPVPETELQSIRKRLIHRHIAWLYALRGQLLEHTSWEHPIQKGLVGQYARRWQRNRGIGTIADEEEQVKLTAYLEPEEHDRLVKFKNTATQIVDQQGQDLAELRKYHIIDDFRHMELQNILSLLYDHQGKAERIKKFPLPRQYANMSFAFVAIFIFLLPFAMVSAFSELGEVGFWLSIPFMVLISWVYVMMEVIADYSENPFQGMPNDIPMLSLCRVIETDLLEMLGETSLPDPIPEKRGVLM